MIYEVKAKGRPKGSTKQVKVLTPENKEGFMLLRRGQRQMASVHEARKKSEHDSKKNLLRIKLQKKYLAEFEAIEFNRYGVIMEHPTKKLLGRILIASKNATGKRLEEYYFPERFLKEKEAKKVNSIRRKLIKDGVTAHDLRMQKVSEDDIKLIYG